MSKVFIGREYPDAIIELVKLAKHSIKILIYDWRWYDCEQGARIQKFNNEIIRARQRGVSVDAFVNNNFICKPLQDCKVNIKRLSSSKTLHIKMLIFDSEKAVIGSHNLTKNAFELNHEMSTLIDDFESVKKCEAFFDAIK